jgi:hypothetical protein
MKKLMTIALLSTLAFQAGARDIVSKKSSDYIRISHEERGRGEFFYFEYCVREKTYKAVGNQVEVLRDAKHTCRPIVDTWFTKKELDKKAGTEKMLMYVDGTQAAIATGAGALFGGALVVAGVSTPMVFVVGISAGAISGGAVYALTNIWNGPLDHKLIKDSFSEDALYGKDAAALRVKDIDKQVQLLRQSLTSIVRQRGAK